MVQRYTFYLNNVLFGGVVRVICGGSIHGLLQLSRFILVETTEALNLEDELFSKLSFSSCRVILKPQKFDPNVAVLEALFPKNGAYYSTITDIRKVSIQPNGWRYSIINAYKKAGIKQWVYVSYFGNGKENV